MTAHDRAIPGRYRLRIADYRLLDEAGAFGDAATELIDGEVIVMSPQYRPHMFVKDELAFRLRLKLRELGSALYVGTEGSVELSEHDMPQPDIVLTTEPRGEGPIPARSVALVVEVADSTLAQDVVGKAPRYAAAHLPEYWVVDLNGRVIRQMWASDGEVYAREDKVSLGSRIASATVDGLDIGTEGL